MFLDELLVDLLTLVEREERGIGKANTDAMNYYITKVVEQCLES